MAASARALEASEEARRAEIDELRGQIAQMMAMKQQFLGGAEDEDEGGPEPEPQLEAD